MKYYTVTLDEDGELHMGTFDNLDDVIEAFEIDSPIDDFIEGGHPAQSFTKELDPGRAGTVLIKGDVLMPVPIDVVKKWEFKGESDG